ncbi:MAG: serine hydrolase [Flavobacteriales bacterium]|nr:serine hydrolase [Flavobacteriales bacterium]
MTRFLFIIFATLSSIQLSAQESYFPPVVGNEWATLSPDSLNWCEENILELYDFLESEDSKAILVLKGGKIVLEKYYGTFTQDSLWYWASAGKTITGFMTGIAQEEGFLDINDPSNVYLDEGWTTCDLLDEGEITVLNQLTMTTGLNDQNGDLDCTDPECLTCMETPGERWSYHNAPYTLLDQVISNATGMNLNFYTYTRLGIPIGMQGAFVQIEYNNVFFSTPRDMARFGVLMANGGMWDGVSIMEDQDYFNAMITPSQTLNKSYGYLWWLNGQENYMLPGFQLQIPGYISPNAPADVYAAIGKNGQLLSISPSEDLIVVRMGNATEDAIVSTILHDDIWERIMNLACTSNLNEGDENTRSFVYPNPASDRVFIEGSVDFTKAVDILDASGRICFSTYYTRAGIDINALSAGLYLIRFTDEIQGRQETRQLVISQ